MKKLLIALLSIALLPAFATCRKDTIAVVNRGRIQESNRRDATITRMKLKIGSKTFNATLLNNATVTAFKAMLPLTLTMKELNGNEKFAQLSADLPVQASNPGTIRSGDLMLYGSNTLVLFYKAFPTAYSYTRFGRVDDLPGLAKALGAGDVTITFELE